jgi:hypothetical protein
LDSLFFCLFGKLFGFSEFETIELGQIRLGEPQAISESLAHQTNRSSLTSFGGVTAVAQD